MNNAAAFGSYVPGCSTVHRINAQVKILLACAFSIGVFFVDTWLGMLLLWVLVLAGYAASRISFGKALAGLAPIAFILVFTVLVNGITIDFSNLQNSCFSSEGLLRGFFFALRIAVLVAACSLLTFTTSQAMLTMGLQSILRPLRILHVPVDDVCMVISMALRFIPTITQEAYAVRRAQASRGALFEGGGVAASIKAWTAVLIPLFVRLFKRVDVLAQAMSARCYTGEGRGSLHRSALRPQDALALVGGVVAVVALGVFL